MSAIWGCIDLSGNSLETDIHEKMSQCTKKYKIDKTEKIQDNNIYMACGLQYFTKESYNEVLPYKEGDLYFTADCVLNEREKLILELNKVGFTDASEMTPDGQLLFWAWKKWRSNFGEHVEGLFSFAVYDETKNEFYLYTDHTSSRCVHYYIDGSRVYFATLTSSITDAVPTIKISEKWMSACMANSFLSMLLFPGLSPFEDVNILGYACGIKASITNEGVSIKKRRYWNPLENIEIDKKRSDEVWKKRFIKVHSDCVKDAIRTDGEVGILLSSGLDSSSVASFSAKHLNDESKKLFSFTSIPLKDFDQTIDNSKNYWIDDETFGIECLCKKYNNIDPEYIDCEGKSVLTEIETTCDYLEFPGKALVNHVWMSEAYRLAREKNCKVVLCGAYGNDTISYGSLTENICITAKEGHLLTAFCQIMKWARKENVSRKGLLLFFIGKVFSKKESNEIDFLDEKIFRKELINKYKIKEEWEKRIEREGDDTKVDIKYHRAHIMSELLLQLIGMYDTKDGLYNGLLLRDPTSDKRMLELCLELPYKCYAWDGVERRLIREYLKEFIPEKILNVKRKRGRQSGDAVLRYEKYGLPNGSKAWEVLSDDIKDYFNYDEAINLLKEKTTHENIVEKAKVLACNYFIAKYKKSRE